MKINAVTLRRQSTLIIWGIAVAYTLIVAVFTDIVLTQKHYVGFCLLGVATIAQLLKKPACYLITFAALIIGFFAPNAFLPGEYYIRIGSLTMSIPYLPLIIYFLIINRKDLPDWIAYVLSKD